MTFCCYPATFWNGGWPCTVLRGLHVDYFAAKVLPKPIICGSPFYNAGILGCKWPPTHIYAQVLSWSSSRRTRVSFVSSHIDACTMRYLKTNANSSIPSRYSARAKYFTLPTLMFSSSVHHTKSLMWSNPYSFLAHRDVHAAVQDAPNKPV